MKTWSFALIFLSLLGAASNAFSQALRFECPDLSNQNRCAQRYESQVAAKYPSLLKRTSENLTISLKNGAKKMIPDSFGLFSIVAVQERSNSAVLREQYSEGNAWHLLDLKNGGITEIGGFPVFSPDETHFLAFEPVDDSGYNPVVAALFRKDSDGRTTPVLTATCKTVAWGPTAPKWRSNSLLTFEQVRLTGIGEFTSLGQVRLQLKSGRWQTTGLKC